MVVAVVRDKMNVCKFSVSGDKLKLSLIVAVT